MIRGLSSKPLALLAIIGAFALLFVLNFFAPYLPGDDLLYQLKFPDEGYIGNEGISDLRDFFESVINHYCNYNYRILPHAILQLVLLFPSYIFDVLNSVAFLLLPLVLMRSIRLDSDKRISVYFFILMLIWCFHPDINWSYFWTSGSLSYTWLLLPQLYILTSLFKKFDKGIDFDWRDLLCALLICTGSENALLGIFTVSLIVLTTGLKGANRTKDRYFIISVIVMLLGGIVMLISPAMGLRRATEAVDLISSSHLFEYVSRLAYYLILLIPVLISFVLSGKKGNTSTSNLLILVCMSVSIISMYFAPIFEARSFVFPFMVFIMLCLSILKSLSFRVYLIVILIIIGRLLFLARFESLSQVWANKETNDIILQERPRGSLVKLDSYCISVSSRNVLCDDINERIDHFHNKTVAARYGHKAVELLPKYLVEDIHDQVRDEIENRGSLTSFQLLKETEDGIRVHNALNEKYNYEIYLFEAPLNTDIIIVRSKKNRVYNFFLNILPKKIRIHFYDILEMDREGLLVNDKKYFVCKVFNPEAYDSYLFAKYSKEKHRTEGRVFQFNSPYQVTQE